MKNDVDWTDERYEAFVREGMLSDRDAQILKMTIHGETITYRSIEGHMGTATVSRRIRWMRKRYDEVQPSSKILPMRRVQKAEKRTA